MPIFSYGKVFVWHFYFDSRAAVAQWIEYWTSNHGVPSSSQHVVVSLGKTLHPKLLLWGSSTVLNVCKSLWIKRLTNDM